MADVIAPGWSAAGALDALASAWVAALGELEDVARGREAVVETKSGGSYRYRYADLGDVLSQARAVLADHDLAVFQVAQVLGDDVVIATTVMHTSGAHLTFAPFHLPAGTTVQATGSAITYGRRYALMSILGLATDDDDGAGAGRRPDELHDAPPVLHPSTVAGFLDRAVGEGLDDTAIAAVVEQATGGRTRDPAQVYADELDVLRATLADHVAEGDEDAPAGDDARQQQPVPAAPVSRAQLAAINSAERRLALGLDRAGVVAAVVGRSVDDDGTLSVDEADRLLQAYRALEDGTAGIVEADDGTLSVIARTPGTDGLSS